MHSQLPLRLAISPPCITLAHRASKSDRQTAPHRDTADYTAADRQTVLVDRRINAFVMISVINYLQYRAAEWLFSSPLSQNILIFSMIICLNFCVLKVSKNLSIIATDRIMGKMRMIILTTNQRRCAFHLLKTEEVGFSGDTITITFRNICVPSFSLTENASAPTYSSF